MGNGHASSSEYHKQLVLQMAVWAEKVSAGAAFCQALEALVPRPAAAQDKSLPAKATDTTKDNETAVGAEELHG